MRLLVGCDWRGNIRELSKLKVIEQCGGNKRKAAKQLGIGATSLYRKLGDPSPDGPEP